MLKSAVILCGGKGTRLGALGKKLPKSLVRIDGKPIIWYILKTLKKNKFNHFILPVGYKGSMISNYIRNNNEFKDYKIQLINTGTNSSINPKSSPNSISSADIIIFFMRSLTSGIGIPI